MSDDKILKSIFLFFFLASNTSSNFFIIPILYENLIQINKYPKWYIIGNIYSIHEFGKFLGNYFWIFLNKYFSSSILILISLFFLSIFNISFIFIKSYHSLLIYRFLLGFSNNLTTMTENIFLELSLKKDFGLILYIIKSLSTLISIIIPINVFQFNNQNKKNKFMLPSITLFLINIFSITITIIMIKLNYLKLFLEKKTTQINVLYNDSENNTIKSSKKFSIEISNQNEKEKSEKKINKKKSESTITNSDDTFERSVQSKIANNENNTNRYETNNNSKDIESIDNKQKNKNNNSDNPISPGNFSRLESVQLTNKNIRNNHEQNNKELKFTFIYIFLNINDSIFFIWIIMFLYNKFNSNSLSIGIYFSLYNLIFSILNYPLTRRLIKKQISRKKLSNKMIFHLILLILFTLLDGIGSYIYIIINRNYEIIVILLLFIFNLIRNLINSFIIQMFQIYISKEFNIQSESMRKLQKLKQYLTSLFKTIIIIFSSLSYYFFSLKLTKLNFQNSFSSILYFILIPEMMLNIIIILIKLLIKH